MKKVQLITDGSCIGNPGPGGGGRPMSGALPLGWPFKTTRAQALVVESDAKG